MISLFGDLTFGRGDLFPGRSFGNVRVMSSYPSDREEDVSVLIEAKEG